MLTKSMKTPQVTGRKLSPAVSLGEGLRRALQRLAGYMQKKQGIDVHLHLDDSPVRIHTDLKILLYESVSAILGHITEQTATRSLHISTFFEDDSIKVSVHDMRPEPSGEEALAERPFSGLSGGDRLSEIRSRLEKVGGRLEIGGPGRQSVAATLVSPLQPDVSGERNLRKHSSGLERRKRAAGETAESGRNPLKIRILLADDHVLMRNEMALRLSKLPDLEVAGKALDGEHAVVLAEELRPDVILMDINMPRLNGIEATKRILSKWPEIRIIGFSMYNNDELAESMLRAGAVAYVSKSGSTKKLVDVIRRSMNGSQTDQ